MRLLTFIHACLRREKLPLLPRNAEAIHTEWPIREGGVQAAVWTDEYGMAYIAVKTLNTIGKTSGLYDWHRCPSLETDMVVGFIDERPLVVHVFVNVTAAGIELTVSLPPDIESIRDFVERRFAPWGSGEPPMSMTVIPTVDHYAVNSFPTV